MSQLLRMVLGLRSKDKTERPKFEIQPKMVNADVVKMDMKSFRNSRVVREQAIAARKLAEKTA